MQLKSGALSSIESSPLKSGSSPQANAKSGRREIHADLSKQSRISALIAEDEPLAREALKSMLKQEQDVEVVGVLGNGTEAVEAINGLQPDLVFLDIDLPELNGFDVLARLDDGRRPAVVFVTANETAAARAFDVHAIDYLVKPCRRERLQAALDRVRERMRHAQNHDLHRKVEALLSSVRQEPKSAERIAIKSNGRIVFVRLADIDWAEAADNYVNLHVGQDSHLFRETMNALETRLSPKRFVRISRSAMVNIEQIKELQPMFHGEYVVVLRNGTKLTLTRGYREKLRELSLM